MLVALAGRFGSSHVTAPLQRHELDHANAPVLATAPVVAARARLGLRRSGASPRAGGVSCRSVDRQADGDVEVRSRRGRNCATRSAAQLVACVDASFLTARQLRRILRERRRDPRPAAWKATLAAVRGEPRQFQRHRIGLVRRVDGGGSLTHTSSPSGPRPPQLVRVATLVEPAMASRRLLCRSSTEPRPPVARNPDRSRRFRDGRYWARTSDLLLIKGG